MFKKKSETKIREKILNQLVKFEKILLDNQVFFGKNKVFLFNLLLITKQIIIENPRLRKITKEQLDKFVFEGKNTNIESALSNSSYIIKDIEFTMQSANNILSYKQTWDGVNINNCYIKNCAFILPTIKKEIEITDTIFEDCFFCGINVNEINLHGDTRFINCEFRTI